MNRFEEIQMLQIERKLHELSIGIIDNDINNIYRSILFDYLNESPNCRTMTITGHTISLRGETIYDSDKEITDFTDFFEKNEELFNRIMKNS